MTLRRTIILSLALHALLLGTGLAFARFAGLHGDRGRPIMVALVSPDTGGSSRSAAPGSIEGRPRSQDDHRAAAAPLETQPAPRPAARDAAEPAAQASGGMHKGVAADMPVTAAPSGAAEGTGVAEREGTVPSEQWAVIVSSIEKAKTYPRLARQNGIEGVVRLRFRVRPQGDVERVEVVKSSGSDILDSASVKTIYRAAPLPFVRGWVEVPIAYVLQ